MRTAKFWNTYLEGVFDRKLAEWMQVPQPEFTHEGFLNAIRKEILNDLIDSWDVGWMVGLMKTSRSTVTPHKGDHFADWIGYGACAYNCSVDWVDDNWAAHELEDLGLDHAVNKPQTEARSQITTSQTAGSL